MTRLDFKHGMYPSAISLFHGWAVRRRDVTLGKLGKSGACTVRLSNNYNLTELLDRRWGRKDAYAARSPGAKRGFLYGYDSPMRGTKIETLLNCMESFRPLSRANDKSLIHFLVILTVSSL